MKSPYLLHSRKSAVDEPGAGDGEDIVPTALIGGAEIVYRRAGREPTQSGVASGTGTRPRQYSKEPSME
jgi:hypothetical protein